MSGITGIIGRETSEEQLREMVGAIRHRGPDNTVVRKLAGGGIACCELAVSDRSTSAIAGSEHPFVLFDGDLYSQLPPGWSNAELVLDLYQQHGKECLGQLDGSFTCVIVDPDEVVLARDPVGSRPLIYRVEEDCLYFASEAKALLGLVDEVDELPPSHYYSTREGLRKFTGYCPGTPDFETPEEAAAILRDLMVEAVRKRMADGAVKGVSLSGGLDSSVVAAIAKTIDPGIKLFSTTIKRYPSPDIKYARMMAEYLRLEHYIYEISDEDIQALIPKAVWYMETFDEDCVSGAIANFYTSRMIAEYTNTILVGEGADELFGGYFRELRKVEGESRREEIACKLVEVAYNTALRRLDRGWLSNSVNYRTPYLDPSVVAFSTKIPMSMKVWNDRDMGKDIEKWILRQAFKDWLPEEIVNRPKLRFAGGTGVDDLMDELTSDKVSEADYRARLISDGGLAFHSPKELYYYQLFRKHFPVGYEKLTVRWDPFK